MMKASNKEKSKIKSIVKNNNHGNKSIGTVISFVKETGGLEYANQVMRSFVDDALQILDGFAESAYKDSLKQMVAFTISRNR